MYHSTIITIKSHPLIYTFLSLLAAKCCCSRQVDKRQVAVNAIALLSTVGNVVVEKKRKVFAGLS